MANNPPSGLRLAPARLHLARRLLPQLRLRAAARARAGAWLVLSKLHF